MKSTENALPQNKMATAPVGKLMLTMSLPLMLSMIMEALYNVVDSLFIARVSENALAALSLAFPIQLLVVSISVGTGAGVNAALSRLLGEKDQKGVNDVASNSVFIALLTSLVFLVLGLFFTRPYFASQTADPEIIQLGVDYLSICMIFSFGPVGQIIFQRLLQPTGKTMLSMVSQLVGAAINVIFDPILIFGYFGFPAMGVKGAAIAKQIAEHLGYAYYDNELVTKIAKESGMDEVFVQESGEDASSTNGFLFNLAITAGAVNIGGPSIFDQLYLVQQNIIRDLAENLRLPEHFNSI